MITRVNSNKREIIIMGNENKRRAFLKKLMSFMAFGAGSILSYKRSNGLKTGKTGNIKMGFSEAMAMSNKGARVKKIGCEEHTGVRGDLDSGRSGLVGADLEKRFRDMDEAGEDMQVLSTGGKSLGDAKKDNDFLAEVVKKHPKRFAAFCSLPKDLDEAPKELERAVKELGMVGALVHVGWAGGYMDDRKYWGIYETAVKLDVPIYMHPGMLPPEISKPYLSPYPILSLAMWGFAVGASLNAVRMIVGGVFEKFPDLKIILGHGGEGIPYWLWRMDLHYKDDQFAIDKNSLGNNLKELPSYYFLRNFYITTSGMCWHPVLQFQVSVLGSDRILFATDYPPESISVATKFIDSAPISDTEREEICHLNAERLFKL